MSRTDDRLDGDRAGTAGPFDRRRLEAVSGVLAAATGLDDIAAALVERGMRATGAFAGAVALLTDDGEQLELAAAVGYDPVLLDGWDRFPLDGRNPVSDAVRENRTVVVPSTEALVEEYPHLRPFADRPHALVAFPVIANGRPLGAVALRFHAGPASRGTTAGGAASSAVDAIIYALRDRVDQLQNALDSRVLIEQAKGILAERHGEDMDVAFVRLRQAARSRSARIQVVAQGVIDGTLQI